jgi:hypothetical protein
MKTALHALAITALSALAACTTANTTPAPDVAPQGQTQNVASRDEEEHITGSRLPGKRTDRLVKAIGSQAYKDAKDSVPRKLDANGGG